VRREKAKPNVYRGKTDALMATDQPRTPNVDL
jgi:hypothetical protein